MGTVFHVRTKIVLVKGEHVEGGRHRTEKQVSLEAVLVSSEII